MKTTKFLFAAIMIFFTSFANATEVNRPEAEKQLSKEVQTLIKDIDLSQCDEENFLINFMITSKNEILVTSTNSKDLDAALKSVLNYQKVEIEGIEKLKVYTLKVHVQK